MKVDILMAKQKKLLDKIQDLKEKQETQERKALLRKKVLIGEYFYQLYEQQEGLDKLVAEMNTFLVKTRDRKLFGLKEKE